MGDRENKASLCIMENNEAEAMSMPHKEGRLKPTEKTAFNLRKKAFFVEIAKIGVPLT